MTPKERLKSFISTHNPLAISRRQRMRNALVNTTPSFLCPNCIGGILFHDLGLQFRSPTVNTMMTQRDFVKFITNASHYLSLELDFFDHPEYRFPCAHLDDITIHFTHYQTAEVAREKWVSRKNRIDWNNLFIFATERDGLTQDEILSLGHISCRGIVVFTANSYPNIPYAVQIPQYSDMGEVGNILEKSWRDESREYERYFDFVKWFNEADGTPYCVEPFVKR